MYASMATGISPVSDRGRHMKSIPSMIAIAALAFTLPAQAAVGDPEVILYRIPGVIDNNTGFATIFWCTNFSGVPETLRVVVRGPTGTLVANSAVTVNHVSTAALATRDVNLFTGETIMNTGVIDPGGTAAIAATSTSISCTAAQIQHFTTGPISLPLHMTRFNPLSGSQE
jgi:hypothetical protein